MWGARGDNGLRSEVRALKATVENLPERFREELDEALDRLEGRGNQSRSQRLVIIGILVAASVTFISAIITSIATVVH